MGQIVLVRHGQASFGAADYDVLSPHGERQAGVVGRALAEQLTGPPDLVVHGSMRRQVRTASLLAEGAGWEVATRLDERWNEMDHLAVVAAHPVEQVPGSADWADGKPDKHQFQHWFELATARWTSGEFDRDYTESFPDFRARVAAALAALADEVGSGTAVVVTSGGPVAGVTTDLLAAGLSTYTHLTVVVANASLTRVVTGRRGLSLVSFNEHGHLAGDLLTYR